MSIAVGINTTPNSASSALGASNPAVSPPAMAPRVVAISNVIPSRMLAGPCRTLALATALLVAITVTMLVATA